MNEKEIENHESEYICEYVSKRQHVIGYVSTKIDNKRAPC